MKKILILFLFLSSPISAFHARSLFQYDKATSCCCMGIALVAGAIGGRVANRNYDKEKITILQGTPIGTSKQPMTLTGINPETSPQAPFVVRYTLYRPDDQVLFTYTAYTSGEMFALPSLGGQGNRSMVGLYRLVIDLLDAGEDEVIHTGGLEINGKRLHFSLPPNPKPSQQYEFVFSYPEVEG